MTLAWFDLEARTMEWTGVGNVEARFVRAGDSGDARHASPVVLGGVVGYNLPQVRLGTIPLEPGDAVVLATDGVAADFSVSLASGVAAQELAERVLERHGKGTDDALAAVVRYLGPPAAVQVLPAPGGGGSRTAGASIAVPERGPRPHPRTQGAPLGAKERAGTLPGMNSPRNLAASAGRWSAQHRKTAILGWILFVVVATFAGKSIARRNCRWLRWATASPSAPCRSWSPPTSPRPSASRS